MAVPLLPGVPPLLETIKRNIISTGLVLLRDYFVTPANQVWGVFDKDGNQILFPDSFIGLDFQKNYRISDYPTEKGSFSSFNKVETPYSNIIGMSKGGSQNDRAAFLKVLNSISGDLLSYTIITPDDIFLNANIERFDYVKRPDQGANMVNVNISFRQIRPTPSIRYSQTRSGGQITSTIPKDQITNSTTSTGIASPTDTAQPSAQATTNNGAISAVTVSGETGVIQ